MDSTLTDFQKEIDVTRVYVKNDRQSLVCSLPAGRVRILSWNIERGYQPDIIAAYLDEMQPDIVCLQEVDWNNERTDHRDVLDYLARRLGMRGYFGVEYFEIDSPHRPPRLAGGGVHGNAILTRLQPARCFRIELPQYFDWLSPPARHEETARTQPRTGARFALCAEFEVGEGSWMICSAHLENMDAGVQGRFAQFLRIAAEMDSGSSTALARVICGDFNTQDNWITSLWGLSRREKSLQKPWYRSECAWWKQALLPATGYVDPFGCREWTFVQDRIYRAKLDWILQRNCRVLDYGLGDFNTSDHRPLWVDLEGA